MMPSLDMHAETFPPSGGMAADGMKKLLGNPALTLLQTVIRETVQNSWDARVEDDEVEFRISLRHLTSDQVHALQEHVFSELPPHRTSSDPLKRFLKSKNPVVMELSDWGTRGLGGPSRADIVPAVGEHNNFVNFVRNMGARRDRVQGGGTYGYGKSSLYLMSQCATVLIDSLANKRAGSPIRRFIGCHLGDAHDVRKSGRLTGRHWWGLWDEVGELIEPVQGREAASLGRAVGLPDRGKEDSGTTLVVLDPDLDGRSLQDVAAEIQETLLWFLWPKMLRHGRKPPAMRFVVEVDGESLPLPEPETFPPLDLFIEAYRAVKNGTANVVEIWSERPAQLLGHCAIQRGLRGRRNPLMHPDETIIPHASSHIALMRPVELVVKYIEGTALPSEGHEWAGVFICSDEPAVEQAFADAEPPAHDDWIPDKMPKGWPKTYVRVALSRLRQLAASYAYPHQGTGGMQTDQPSLAKAADRLGEYIPFFSPADGDGGGGGGGGGGGSGGGGGGKRRGRWRVGEPRFLLLEEGAEGGEAVFEVHISNGGATAFEVTAMPAVVIDGSLADSGDAGEDPVRFLGWEDQNGTSIQSAPRLAVPAGVQAAFRMRVGVPGEAAVGIRVALLEGLQP